MRIFIHGVDTYLGRTLVRELRPGGGADGGNHRIFGTVIDPKSGRAPAVVKRCVSREDTKRAGKMTTTIQSCRIVVMDLFSCSLDDVYFVLSALGVDGRSDPPRQTKRLEKDVILIVVSSLMVWADTVQPGSSRPASPEVEEAEVPDADGDADADAADGEEDKPDSGAGDAEVDSDGEPAAEADGAVDGGELVPDDRPASGAGDGEGSQPAKSKPSTPVPAPTPPPPPDLRKPLKDSDYPRRKAVNGSRYAVWRDMEELVMSCFNREDSQVKAFICAGGVLYGEGEELLSQLFKDAWLGEPTQAVMPPGTNTVPTVHVRDLARLVRHVGFSCNDKPENWDPIARPFFVAVDPKPITQRELLQGIADELCGNTAVPTVEVPSRGCSPSPDAAVATRPATGEVPPEGARGDDDEQPPNVQEALSLDLWVSPSDVMMQEGTDVDLVPPPYVADMIQPGWWCKEGFADGLRRAAEEFCWEHRLRGMRVLISGPPGSGRTSLAQAVAEHFRLPHLELIPGEVAESAGEAEDADAGPAPLMVTSYQDPFGPEVPHLDFESPICRYRGYVLDSGPAGFDDMDQLFRYDAPIEAGEDAGDAEDGDGDGDGGDGEEEKAEPKPPKRLLNDDLVPTFVIVLQASESVCRARWSSSQGHPLEKPRSNLEGGDGDAFDQAYAQYRATNMPDDMAQNTLTDFFQTEVGSGVLNMPVIGRDTEELCESVRIYMERDAMRWRYEPFDGRQMFIRSTPSLEDDQKTDLFLAPGTVFNVDKTKVVKYARAEQSSQDMTWLHLTDGRGWVWLQVPGQNVACVKVEAGRPFNYLRTGEEIAAELLAKRGKREEEEAQLAEEQEQEHAGNDAELAELALKRECERMRIIAEHELARKEIEGLPLREYLMKYMIPNLTEGLIEVCKVLPEDPVDYLAAYLERHAADQAASKPR